jgi:hypothetical protein
MTYTLSDCPCCGHLAAFQEIAEGPDVGARFVECTNGLCGLSTQLVFPTGGDADAVLAERWNRRPKAGPEARVRILRKFAPREFVSPRYDVAMERGGEAHRVRAPHGDFGFGREDAVALAAMLARIIGCGVDDVV